MDNIATDHSGGGAPAQPTALTPDVDTALLRARIRLVLAVIILAALTFCLADVVSGDLAAHTIGPLVLQLGAALAGVVLLPRARSQRAISSLGVATIAFSFGCSAVSGALTGDSSGTRLLSLIMTLAAAAVVPWGIAAQTLLAGCGVLAVLSNAWWLGHLLSNRFATTATMVGLLGSIAIAIESRRARRRTSENEAQRGLLEVERERFFDLSIDMLCVADVRGYLRRVNAAMSRALDYSVEELIAVPFLEFVHPADRAATSRALGRLAHGEEVRGFVNRYRRRDGEYLWLEWNARASSDGLISAVARDITERRQSLQGTVDALSANIAVLDGGGNILAVNAAWRHFADANGLRDEHYAVGQNYFAVCRAAEATQPEVAEVVSALAQLRGGGDEIFVWEYRCDSPAERRWFEMRATRFILDDRERIVVAHENITNRKLAEEAALAARDQAIQMSQQKSQFLAIMSHEIRTPLGAMIGLVDLLRETELDDEQRSFAETVHRSGLALLGIVNDILDLAKIEAGRMDLHEETFSLRDLIEDVVYLFAAETRRKGISLQHSIAEEVPAHVIGDRGRIRQILTNLVGNAVKFTERGGVTLAIHSRAGGAGRLLLSGEVSDTGIGISEAGQRGLFESYTRGSSADDTSGTGLGLVICKQLVELMHGAIRIRSDLGAGTSVTFTIELGTATSAEHQTRAAQGTAERRPAGKRILVVEDNVLNQTVACRLLEKLGFVVDLAADGATALRLFQQRGYDAVLMDCFMPGMDGYQTVAQLRKEEAERGQRRTVVIALTADATVAARDRCLAAGMDDYITKPATLAQMQAKLDHWLGGGEPPPVVDQVDLAGALGRLGGDRDLLIQLVHVFLESYPQQLRAVAEAAASRDRDALESSVHALKGALSNFSQATVLQVTQDVERLAREDRLEEALARLPMLRSQVEELATQLRALADPAASEAT